jgi:hypothetical protein
MAHRLNSDVSERLQLGVATSLLLLWGCREEAVSRDPLLQSAAQGRFPVRYPLFGAAW